jgi:hypothetical protein
MITLTSIKFPKKAVIIAETLNDAKSLDFFFGISWGFYLIWTKSSEKNDIKDDKIRKIVDKFPNAYAIGMLHSDDGFVDNEEIKAYKEKKRQARLEKEREQELNNFVNELTGDF